MSSKLSPKKDDKITPASPSKKDSKVSPPAIMTRQKAVVMNTRQLRNQDASRKKISAFTQLLLSPHKDKNKTTTFNKKRSPKDKKNKTKESPKKRETVKVTQLVLESKKEIKTYGRKRKNEAEHKEAPPVKSRKEPTLSVQDLMDMCEDQSLDDEDFLEILTCESPVWWEQPDNQFYCEDAIATTAEQKRYFQQFFKSQVKIKTEVPDIPTPATTNINIPEVKKIDDKFMKKRNKLENVLGNIKHNLTDLPKEEEQKEQITERRLLRKPNCPEKTEINENAPQDITKEVNKVDEKATEDEKDMKTARKDRPLSESTSSSDDMFFGFQNEEILKDLENMEIPIKQDEQGNDSLEPTNTSPMDHIGTENNNRKDNETIIKEGLETESSTSTDHIMKDKNVLDVNKKASGVPKENKPHVEAKVTKSSVLFDTITNTTGIEENSGNVSILEKCLSNSSKTTETQKSCTSEAKTSNTSNSSQKAALLGKPVVEKSSCRKSNTTETHKTYDAVKIYYIDASTPKNDRTTAVKDDNLHKGVNSDEITKINKNDDKSLSSSVIAEQKQKSSDDQCEKAITLCKEKEKLSSEDIIAKQANNADSMSKLPTKPSNEKATSSSIIDNKTNESNNKIKDESTEKLVNVDKNTDIKKGNKDKDGKETTKHEKDCKPIKLKQVNKNQLMAVYKIITEQQYKQNCMKTTENEVQNVSNINNIVSPCSSKSLDKGTDSKSLTAEVVHTKDKESSAEKEKNSNENEEISNAVSQNINVHIINKIEPENKTPLDAKINTQDKEVEINKNILSVKSVDSKEIFKLANKIEIKKIHENKLNEQTIADNVHKTDTKDNNEKLCGNCEESNTETSFNITSKVKSAKYCLKCSSIFESETCSYCAKKTKLIIESSQTQQPRKGNN
ncbi:hypothetical protein O0L34_g10542 [Tuta absoluta]|nr:hypothetical protein O0L34_g10542 [Tuta absoluta]